MKKNLLSILSVGTMLFIASCGSSEKPEASVAGASTTETTTQATGQSGVADDVSAKNVVQTSIGSKDQTTLWERGKK